MDNLTKYEIYVETFIEYCGLSKDQAKERVDEALIKRKTRGKENAKSCT